MGNYIVQADLLTQLSQAQLVQLTDDAKTGSVNITIVDDAIGDAESEIDSYVQGQKTVPLVAPIPRVIKKYSIDIAIYDLYRRRQRIPEDVRKAYEDALAWLKMFAKGLVGLGDEAPKAASGEVFGPERIFDRDKLGSF